MKHYEEPMISVEEIEVVDVITTSPEGDDWGGGDMEI